MSNIRIMQIVFAVCMAFAFFGCEDSGSNSPSGGSFIVDLRIDETYCTYQVDVDGVPVDSVYMVPNGATLSLTVTPRDNYLVDVIRIVNDNGITETDSVSCSVNISSNTLISCTLAQWVELIDEPMTSNTSYSGVSLSAAAGNTISLSDDAYLAFDDDEDTSWSRYSASTTPGYSYMYLTFDETVTIDRFYIDLGENSSGCDGFSLTSSYDGSTNFITRYSSGTLAEGGVSIDIDLSKTNPLRKYWRFGFYGSSMTDHFDIEEMRIYSLKKYYPQ